MFVHKSPLALDWQLNNSQRVYSQCLLLSPDANRRASSACTSLNILPIKLYECVAAGCEWQLGYNENGKLLDERGKTQDVFFTPVRSWLICTCLCEQNWKC